MLARHFELQLALILRLEKESLLYLIIKSIK